MPGDSDRIEPAAFTLLLAFVATAPLLYGLDPPQRNAIGGGVMMPSGTLLLEIFAFTIGGATFLSRSRSRLVKLPVPALGAAIALVALGLGQLVPLPEGFLERVAPTNLLIYRETDEILRLLGRSGHLLARVSIAPTETVGALLLIGGYVALFLSAVALLRNRMKRRAFSAVLLVAACGQILLAVIREPVEDRVHGTFVNPDQLAGYLEIALAFAFGSLWSEVLMGSDRARTISERPERFEKRFVPLGLRVLVWALIAVGIGLTQSRGGILSAALMTLVLLGMAILHRPREARLHRQARNAVAAAVLLGILFVATTAGGRPFLRFLQLNPRHLAGNARVDLWRTSIRAWQEFPFVGSGLGTFREAFRRVQPRDFPGLVEHAHADSLQVLVTGGAVGAALGWILFASLFFSLIRLWRRQRHREESAVVLAGFGALLSLTLHGCVDFNLSIPAIAATLACAIGAAWAAGIEK